MKTADYDDFRDLLSDVHTFYERELSEFALNVWWQALRPFDLQTIKRAFGLHTVNPDFGQYLPKPADITRLMGGSGSDSSMQAWSKVDAAVRSVGVYESVVFDDAIIHKVLEEMGGWISLGMKNENDWPFVAKEFQTRYRGYAMRHDCGADYLRVLVGMNEAQNSRSGFQSRPPLLIGDVSRCQAVMNGGAGTGRLAVNRLGDAAQRPALKVLEGGLR